MKEKKHILWLDIVRILACILVVLTHSPLSIEGMDRNIIYDINNFITSPCIPLFFMLSGYLILPVNLPLKAFLSRRLSRIIIPMIFWSLLWLFIFNIICDRIGIENIIIKLFRLPFKNIVGVYWYIYSLAGLYLFAPIISKWLQSSSKREIEYYLILWGITLVLPYINIILPGCYDSGGDFYNPLYMFGGFLGFFILGYYIRKYSVHLSYVNFIICFMLLFIRPALSLMHINGIGGAYLKIDIAAFSFFIFLICRCLCGDKRTSNSIISDLSNLTFGIYLIHFFVLKGITQNYIYSLHISLSAKVLFTFISTFLISLVIVKAVSFLPFRKYLIG